MSNIKDGQGRIWWNSHIDTGYDGEWIMFYHFVENLEQAKFALNLLSQYDLKNDLITDNRSGFHHYHEENDEWIEFEDENGDDIWTIIDNESKLTDV